MNNVTNLRYCAKLLRQVKRERYRRPKVVAMVEADCQRLCIALGLPENAASGTRKHLEESLANLQLNPKR